MTNAVQLAQYGSVQNSFKNRIINGGMVIDQRNAGAEKNPAVTDTYYLDRWAVASGAASKFKIQQDAGAVTPPTGFNDYLGCTSLSAYTAGASEQFGIYQPIEGYNVADLDFGKATAKTITISFWVRSSLTGTFGGSLRNSAANRSYPFSYTISVANTWEQKSVTITGDTSGTWLVTNGVGMYVFFSIGSGSTVSGTAGSWAAANYVQPTGATSVVGTSGATFYITGVQLEKGSTATSFDYRPYGTELSLCQRYYIQYTMPVGTGGGAASFGCCINGTIADSAVIVPVPMRVTSTSLALTTNTLAILVVSSGVSYSSGTFAVGYLTNNLVIHIRYTHGSAVFTGGVACLLSSSGASGYLGLSGEL